MNDLFFTRSGAPNRSSLRPALTPWYASRDSVEMPVQSGMRFGEFQKIEAVRHNAKAFSKETVKKLSNRESSDDSDSGPCWSDYERDPSKKPGEKGSCRPKDSSKKKRKKEKKGDKDSDGEKVEKKKYDAAAVAGKGGIHKKGSDADGDGKTGEGKKKITDFSDRDGNGKPDVFEVSVTESSSSDESGDEGMKKKRSNASVGEDCGCGCEGDPSKKKSDCDGLKKTIDKASAKEKKEKKKTNGVIHRASDGTHDYYVYWKGRKISFGDASMPNKNHSDKHRENFNARHNCSEKRDKSKAGYCKFVLNT